MQNMAVLYKFHNLQT